MRKLPFEYAVRNLGRSPSRLLMSAGGCGLVVLLAMAAGGFVNGMQNSLTISGSPRNVILMGAGSEESVERSEIPMRTPGIAATGIRGIVIAAGVEAISPEVHLAIPVQLQSVGDAPPEAVETNALFRGITPSAFLVHQEARLTDGRFPETGADEVAIGRLAARSLGLEDTDGILGSTLIVDERPFSIVGVVDADGGVIEGEIWIPLSDLLIVGQRDTLSCVVIRTTDGDLSSARASGRVVLRRYKCSVSMHQRLRIISVGSIRSLFFLRTITMTNVSALRRRLITELPMFSTAVALPSPP